MSRINISKIILIISILVLIIVIVGFVANIIVSNKIENDLSQLRNRSNIKNEEIITLDDIDDLPTPVKNWLLSINLVGTNKKNMVSFSQKGKMYLSKDQVKPYKSIAKQYVRINEPSFIWSVDVAYLPFVKVKGIDKFDLGAGSMKMLLASVFPVVDENNNEKLNESSLSRFLLELPWYPSAALEKYITWEELDKFRAKATINYKNMKSEVIYYFDENYNLVKMEGLRFKDTSNDSERITCIGEVVDSKIINGLRIPNKIDVSWIENDSKFTWYKIEEIDFNFF